MIQSGQLWSDIPCVFIAPENIPGPRKSAPGIIPLKFVSSVLRWKRSTTFSSKIYSSPPRQCFRPSISSSQSVSDRSELKPFQRTRVSGYRKRPQNRRTGAHYQFLTQTLFRVFQAAWCFLGTPRDLSETGYPSLNDTSHMTDAEHHLFVNLKSQIIRCIILGKYWI